MFLYKRIVYSAEKCQEYVWRSMRETIRRSSQARKNCPWG